MLRLLYLLIIVICFLPTIPGLLGAITTSLGYVPALESSHFSLLAFRQLAEWPSVMHSITLTLLSTLVNAILTCFFTFAILQSCWNTKAWKKIEFILSPLLAMPHVAFVIGFTLLFSSTGFGMRSLVQLFSVDPSSSFELIVHDPYAVGLTLALTLKEIPFLLLMSIPILQQLNVSHALKVSSSLGYTATQSWWKCIFPQWLRKIRFPLLAIIAYSLSVVDIALIIGPTNPPTFAVLVWQWFNDPDLTLLPRAAAGAVVLFALTCLFIAFTRLVEWLITRYCNQWQYSGRYGWSFPGKAFFGVVLTVNVLILPLLAIWSMAQRWRFPDLLPSKFSSRFWVNEWDSILNVASDSILIAIISSTLALVLALIAHEYRLKYRWQVPGYIIAIPMLFPQLSILFGIQTVALYVNSDNYFLLVCWAHLFFIFPYVYLALDGPWRSYNPAYCRVGASLGKSPTHVWWRIKLPILFSAVTFAWAVGMSVSLAQYLPTLMLGAGRVSTITTEAVALSSGSDRRVSAIYAISQVVLPLIFFSLAMVINYYHNHKRSTIIQDIRK